MEASTSSTPATDAVAAKNKPAGKPAAPTRYAIGVDQTTVDLVVAFGDQADPPLWKAGESDPFPADLDPRDVVYVGTAEGGTREQAVDAFLDAQSPSADNPARADAIRAAEQAGVALLFTVVPAGYIGEVPVKTEIERKRKTGKR